MARRRDIEGMRAVALLLVLAFHAGLPLQGGFVGVDVFFVISGFLITGLLLRDIETHGAPRFLEFYARRARRLIPAASVVLVSVALVAWKLAPPMQRRPFELDVAMASAFTVNWRFAARAVDYTAGDIGRSPVLHFWSLSVEEQFYFLWPSLMLAAAAGARRMRIAPQKAIGAVLALVVATSLSWSVDFTAHHAHEAFFASGARLWELGIGGLLALVAPRARTLRSQWALPLILVGAALIALSAFLFHADVDWPAANALYPTLGASFLIVGGSIDETNLGSRILSTRPLVFIGGISYSVYLWHWPALVVGEDWLGHRGPLWGSALALGSFVPAWVSHRFVERPIRFSRYLSDHSGLALSLGINLSLICIGIAGLVYLPPVERPVVGASAPLPPPAGARALGRNPRTSPAGIPRNTYERITPTPGKAFGDVSRGHIQGCLVFGPATEPVWCESGDPHGLFRVAVVGDSKIFQYFDALDEAGKALGWKITTAAKAACPFSDATVLDDVGAPYDTCTTFNRAALEQLRADPPDAIITSQGASRAIVPSVSVTVPNPQAMVDGLVSRWSTVQAWGTKVIVVLDSPVPVGVRPVYECLLIHQNNYEVCAYDRAAAIQHSGTPFLRAAAERVPQARVIDLTDFICPQDKCAPVIGDVLVFRQGFHLTDSYALSLVPMLTAKLALAFADH